MAISTEPGPADTMSPPGDASSRSNKGNGDAGARAVTLIVGMLIGLGIGVRIGDAARKRMDRWKPCY
jgi:hypothetical protein